MTDVNRIEGDFNATGKRFAIIAGRFNSFVVDHRVSGAVWIGRVAQDDPAAPMDVQQQLADQASQIE